MIAQQLLRLIQQLSFVYGAGTLVTPPQLLQDLLPCRLTHCFIHSRHGNSHFWHNVSFPLSLTPLPGNKTSGAIRGLEGFPNELAAGAESGIIQPRRRVANQVCNRRLLPMGRWLGFAGSHANSIETEYRIVAFG